MCELLTAKSNEPIPIEWVLDYAKLLDEYGLAGFGWGVTWKTNSGQIQSYRAVEGIRKDTLASQSLRGIKSNEYFVHLRRPSMMKTMAFINSQPYVTEGYSLAFGHNGYFENHDQYRPLFEDRLVGSSDSEIGFHYFLKQRNEQKDDQSALELTHKGLGGKANLVVFREGESTLYYAGNVDNKMYSFHLDGVKCVSTSLHSLDDFVFQTIFPRATQITQIPLFTSFVQESKLNLNKELSNS